jgi:hypothetical protein
MKNIKMLTIVRMLIAYGFALTWYAAAAQNTGEPAKPHKRTIKARNPKYSEVADYTYWVQGDTVYNCQVYSGQKIAIADIDFGVKEIVKSETLEEGTNNNVYVITLNLIKGKKSYSCGCVMGELSGPSHVSGKAVKIVERGEAWAELKFNALHLTSLQQKIAASATDSPLPRDTTSAGDTTSAIDKILAEHKAKQVPADDVPPPTDPSTAGTGEFDAHLLALINGLKDDFATLKGAQVPGADEYEAKVILDGSVNTRVIIGSFGHTFLLAGFGEFSTVEAALPVYQRISSQVEDSKKMPVSMVKQSEAVSEAVRINSWLPYGDVDPGLKGFGIAVELVKSFKFDKQTMSSKDIYFVQLKIDK